MENIEYYCPRKKCSFITDKTCIERLRRLKNLHNWRVQGIEMDGGCIECDGKELIKEARK